MIGPRMKELCQILRNQGGTAKAKSHVYLELNYHGGESNRHGSAVMDRCIAHGLIMEDFTIPTEGNRVPVRLTEKGKQVI